MVGGCPLAGDQKGRETCGFDAMGRRRDGGEQLRGPSQQLQRVLGIVQVEVVLLGLGGRRVLWRGASGLERDRGLMGREFLAMVVGLGRMPVGGKARVAEELAAPIQQITQFRGVLGALDLLGAGAGSPQGLFDLVNGLLQARVFTACILVSEDERRGRGRGMG